MKAKTKYYYVVFEAFFKDGSSTKVTTIQQWEVPFNITRCTIGLINDTKDKAKKLGAELGGGAVLFWSEVTKESLTDWEKATSANLTSEEPK